VIVSIWTFLLNNNNLKKEDPMQKSKKKTSREDFEIEILKKSTLTSAEPKRERLALSLEPKETKRMLLGLE